MGLFGYSAGTYAKNARRFKSEIESIMAVSGMNLPAILKPLNNAILSLSEECTYKGDMDRKEATDLRIKGYLEKLRGAIGKGDKALAIAYSVLIGDAARIRSIGDREENAPIMALREKVVIAEQKRNVALDTMSAYAKKLEAKGIDVGTDPTFLSLSAEAREHADEYKNLMQLLTETETRMSLRKTAEMADSTVLVDFLNEIKRDE